MPDNTKSLARARRKAMRAANSEQNIYSSYAAPYLAALRTIDLHYGYNNLDEIISDYENVVAGRNSRFEEERIESERLAEERRLDRERYTAKKRIRK
jgi:hypothetical protein